MSTATAPGGAPTRTAPEEAPAGLDGAVERLGRRLASRLTRRSFLDRMAKVGVLVAGGPALASLLVDRVEARVCGQSGVSLKCPTFDCVGPGDVWGWCWYASPGCCSNGGLKKICDCCRVNFPNVHGYCPSGTNVRCIVESCVADPRVMAVPVARAGGFTAAAVAGNRARLSSTAARETVVVADADPLVAAIAAPVASIMGAPLLVTARERASSGTIAGLQALGARHVLLVGPSLAPAVEQTLARYVTVERLGTQTTVQGLSLELAALVRQRTGSRRAFCVGGSGVSAVSAPAAGAAAAIVRAPLVVGLDSAAELASGPDPVTTTYMVGPEMASRAGQVPGGFPVGGDSPRAVSISLAGVVAYLGATGLTLALVPEGQTGVATGAVPDRGLIMFHPDGRVGPDLFAWIRANRHRLTGAVVSGSLGTLGSPGIYDLQSVLNAFGTEHLTGVAGQGLPVRSQPLAERPLGRARVAGAPPDDGQFGSYWISRANPDRQ